MDDEPVEYIFVRALEPTWGVTCDSASCTYTDLATLVFAIKDEPDSEFKMCDWCAVMNHMPIPNDYEVEM